MSKFFKKLFILIGFLAAVGSLVVFFTRRREDENELFEEDNDFDDVTMPQQAKPEPSRSYINLV